MKNCFYSFLLFTIFTFVLNNDVKSQTPELVKPVPNVGIKKAENKTTNTSVNNTAQTTDPNSTTKAAAEGQNISSVAKTGHIESNPYKTQNDSPEYQTKKAEWIKNNPDKYKAMSGNPNLIILTEEQLNLLSAEEQARALADEENYLIIR
jgi:hypothetical protein